MNVCETSSEDFEGRTRVPRFRWRIVPASILFILGTLTVGCYSWQGIVAFNTKLVTAWLFVPIWIAGIVWIAAAVAWHRGWWWRASVMTVVGYLLLPLGRTVFVWWSR